MIIFPVQLNPISTDNYFDSNTSFAVGILLGTHTVGIQSGLFTFTCLPDTNSWISLTVETPLVYHMTELRRFGCSPSCCTRIAPASNNAAAYSIFMALSTRELPIVL